MFNPAVCCFLRPFIFPFHPTLFLLQEIPPAIRLHKLNSHLNRFCVGFFFLLFFFNTLSFLFSILLGRKNLFLFFFIVWHMLLSRATFFKSLSVEYIFYWFIGTQATNTIRIKSSAGTKYS